MSKSFIAALLACAVVCSCKKGGGNEDSAEEADSNSVETVADTLHLIEEEAPPVAADELFDDFFFNFASDVKYQIQRIQFPLKLISYGSEKDLTAGEWQRYNRFKAQEFYTVIYEREKDLELQKDTAVSEVCVEWINLKDKRIEQFLFYRQSGKWMLTSITKESMSNSPNGAFLEFYSEFVSDSTFQRENLSEPIKFTLVSEDIEEPEETEEIDADEWFAMQSDMPVLSNTLVNIDYGQTCISQNKKTLLMEGVSNGLFMKFKFIKNADLQWKLVEIEN